MKGVLSSEAGRSVWREVKPEFARQKSREKSVPEGTSGSRENPGKRRLGGCSLSQPVTWRSKPWLPDINVTHKISALLGGGHGKTEKTVSPAPVLYGSDEKCSLRKSFQLTFSPFRQGTVPVHFPVQKCYECCN